MPDSKDASTFCLAHQLPEDDSSPVGLVCARCRHQLRADPPRGNPLCCWESQPPVFGLDGSPCFVYTLIWENFRIRSLHPAELQTDFRSHDVQSHVDTEPDAPI